MCPFNDLGVSDLAKQTNFEWSVMEHGDHPLYKLGFTIYIVNLTKSNSLVLMGFIKGWAHADSI